MKTIYQFRQEFSERLIELLKEKGLSRQRAATKLGCTNATIGHWTRDEAPFCLFVLKQLHDEFGVDLNWLVAGEEKEKE